MWRGVKPARHLLNIKLTSGNIEGFYYLNFCMNAIKEKKLKITFGFC